MSKRKREPSFALAAFAALAACGDRAPVGEGGACFGSSECAPGLICDLAQTPAICTTQGSTPPTADAALDPDGSPADAAPGAIDAAPAVIDAAPIDAAPIDAAPI